MALSHFRPGLPRPSTRNRSVSIPDRFSSYRREPVSGKPVGLGPHDCLIDRAVSASSAGRPLSMGPKREIFHAAVPFLIHLLSYCHNLPNLIYIFYTLPECVGHCTASPKGLNRMHKGDTVSLPVSQVTNHARIVPVRFPRLNR